MKIVSVILRTVASIMVMILGIVMVFNSNFYINGVNTNYQFYGGDAYTGIQHAVADASNNINDIANALENIIEDAYKCTGYFLLFIGIYMLGATLSTIHKNKRSTLTEEPEVLSNSTPSEDSVLENIEKYKRLLDAGIITEEEFTAKKRQLLGI